MERPRITIQLTPFDKVIEILSLLGMLCLFGITIHYFYALSEVIPSHFDFKGNPDDYSKKEMIWTLPIVALVIYISLKFLVKIPHVFNYLTPITEENALHQYTLATRMIRILGLIVVSTFLYIQFTTIQVAMGNALKLSPIFIVIFVLSVFGSLIASVYYSTKKL